MNRKEYVKLLEQSIIIPTDNHRLANFLSSSKTQATIAFLGGSITMGYSVEGQKLAPYPELVINYFTELSLDKREYSYMNFGYACFHSLLGISTLEKIVFPKRPDLIFMEYSVNNGFGEEWAASFEGIIRKLIMHNPNTAIIIVCAIQETGYTCEAYMQKIATHYSLPLISIKNVLAYGAEHGFCWSDYSFDAIHPSRNGHQLIADCINQLLVQSQNCQQSQSTFTQCNELPSCCFSDTFTYAHFIGANELSVKESGSFTKLICDNPFCEGLSYEGPKNLPFIFQIRCRTLYLIFEQNNGPKSMGQTKVTIQPGNRECYVDGHSIFSWGNPAIHKLTDREENDYTITIKMLPQDSNKNFIFYGFLIL